MLLYNKNPLTITMSKIRIKIFSSFCSSSRAKEVYEKICKTSNMTNYGSDKDIYLLGDEDNDYTHAIIWNTAMPALTIPKENVVGLAFEPPSFLGLSHEFVSYVQKYVGKYHIGQKLDGLPDEFVEKYSYMGHSIISSPIQKKTRVMSIIVSQKIYAPGHKYRHSLVQRIIQERLPVYIYGRGTRFYNYEFNMGEFQNLEPFETYMYSICIENYKTPHYFSEKIIDPVICECMPVYWGCEHMGEYLDSDCFHVITGNVDQDIETIKNILRDPMKYYKQPMNDEFANKINILKNIDALFPSV